MLRSLALILSLVTACQTYEFQPVTPIAIAQTTQTTNVEAKTLKPNLMILVDKSGSMNDPVNESLPACKKPDGNSCSGSDCPASCPTRISDLKTAMGQFLTRASTVARMGLALFPDGQVCETTRKIEVRFPAPSNNDVDTSALVANATAVNQRIQSLGTQANPAVGGTPTGGALSFLGQYEGLLDDRDYRQDFVLLLTDGLPNCNPNNPLSCNSMPPPPANLCTIPRGCAGSNFCRTGYLDRDGVVTSVQQLRSRNIITIVVGFGAEFASPEALDVLNSMAAEGGFARKCKNGTDAECGTNNTCLPAPANPPKDYVRSCQKQFYAAANASELATALADIQNLLGTVDACNFPLADKPTDERFLAVIVNGQTIAKGPDTWSLLPSNSIQFAGQLCERVKNSTTAEPLKVEFRIVSTL
jgi:hypothetical protein